MPGPRSGRFSLVRKPWPAPAQSIMPFRDNADDAITTWEPPSTLDSPVAFHDQESDPARFIVEELMPYSRPEHTAANLPLALDDPEAVWWVSSGSVDVFFIQLEPGVTTGRRRHLCRVEEGGSIFSISGVRGRAGGGLLAVGAGNWRSS